MTLVYVGILVLVLLIVAVLVVMQQKKAAQAKARASKKTQVNRKGKKSPNKTSKEHEPKASNEEKPKQKEEWHGTANIVDDAKISVNNVDALTEFDVYKQFGYYAKAAETLADYLQSPQHVQPDLVRELMDLWLQVENVDALSDALIQHQSHLSKEELTKYIKGGLALDSTHLGLRVLAESGLGWSVQQTSEEIGEGKIADAPEVKSTRPAINMYAKQADNTASGVARAPLVSGSVDLSQLSMEEKTALLAFMEPEKSVRFLRNQLSPDANIKYLNRAIQNSPKPASLLIDALTLDYKANNINGFAAHLWKLYHALGQYGRQVKERMLGWGYSLGNHPVFEQLATNPDEITIREIGIQQGWLDAGVKKKANYQSLVVENDDTAFEPRTEIEQVLKEVESVLMYGQLDEAMEVLEKAIINHPQESQLYIALFDLYERAEEWGRLEKMLQNLRASNQTLPEEVVLAMSQLLQRFNNGSFGQ